MHVSITIAGRYINPGELVSKYTQPYIAVVAVVRERSTREIIWTHEERQCPYADSPQLLTDAKHNRLHSLDTLELKRNFYTLLYTALQYVVETCILNAWTRANIKITDQDVYDTFVLGNTHAPPFAYAIKEMHVENLYATICKFQNIPPVPHTPQPTRTVNLILINPNNAAYDRHVDALLAQQFTCTGSLASTKYIS